MYKKNEREKIWGKKRSVAAGCDGKKQKNERIKLKSRKRSCTSLLQCFSIQNYVERNIKKIQAC